MTQQEKLNPPAIGQIWPGQGGIYGGIHQYPEGLCYVIFAAEDVPGRHEYGDYGVKVAEAESRTDGCANTKALLAREGKHPAAIAAAGYSADGHEDFCLPSIAELNHAWAYLPDSFDENWYYISSTQRSANDAFYMGFDDGIQHSSAKDNEFLVRPVRRLLIQ